MQKQTATHVRSGAAQWLAEFVATFGLLLVVPGCPKERVAWTVAAWIGAAYWFTSSTSFANPAITIARSLSDTFAGIRPVDAPAFVLTQTAVALVGWRLAPRLFGRQHSLAIWFASVARERGARSARR